MGDYVHSSAIQTHRSKASCGILEAHHLPNVTARATAFQLATALYHKANPNPAAFILFSDIVPENPVETSRGQRLSAFIAANGLGLLWESTKEVNPRTGNVILAWFFTPNHDKYRSWYKEELANRIEEA